MSLPPRPIIGCMTRPFVTRGASFEEALERIARAGYRHLHFGPNDRRASGPAVVPEAATPGQLSALANLCARHDLAPISMFPRQGGDSPRTRWRPSAPMWTTPARSACAC